MCKIQMHPSFQAWKIIFKTMGKIKPFVFIVVLVFFLLRTTTMGSTKGNSIFIVWSLNNQMPSQVLSILQVAWWDKQTRTCDVVACSMHQ